MRFELALLGCLAAITLATPVAEPAPLEERVYPSPSTF